MKANTQLTRSSAFVLRENSVSKIVEKFSEQVGDVAISCKCSDHIDRDFDDIESLRQYENSKNKEILSMAISAKSSDYSQRASIQFGKRYLATIDVEIAGEESTVASLRQDVIDIIEGTKAWYSGLARINFLYLLVALFLILIYGVKAAFYFGFMNDPNPDSESSKHGDVLGITVALGILLLGESLNRLREKIFPIGAFLVGQGKHRYELMEKFRWAVVVGLTVSLVGGLLVQV